MTSFVRHTALLALTLVFTSSYAWAKMGVGLAMHGDPKYGEDATHLEYANPDAPQGGTLRQAVIGTFDSVNPFALKGKSADGLNLTYDKLMRRVWDEPFTLYPLIARQADINEDRSEITFTLDERARFNDGSPITVEDILFSYETLKEGGRPNMRRVYQLVKNAEIIGDTQIKFSFGEGHDQETALILAMMPVLSKAYWQDKTFDNSTLIPPVTSGPYKITDVDVGRSITYTRDPDYWAAGLPVNFGHHNFETVTYDYLRDDTVALEAFLKGDLDVRTEFDMTKWETAYRDDSSYTKGRFTHGRPVKINALIFNTRRAPFDDIRVRKALNLAFDADWINKNIYFGKMERIKSYFENSELAAPKEDNLWQPPASPDKATYRQNLIEADNLLTAAGLTLKNGKRTLPDGSPFQFEILGQTLENEKIALHFTRGLKRLGIDARVRTMDSAAFRDRLNAYDFDMTLYHWISSLSPGTEQYLYWSCEAAKTEAQWNFAGICSSEIDALAKSIPEAKTREDLVSSVQNLDAALLNQVATIPLFYNPYDLIAYRNNIGHPDETALYGAVIETWWHKGN